MAQAGFPVTSSPKPFKKAGIIRAGFAYQDLMGLKELVDFYQNRDLYEWVSLESDMPDDIDLGFLDDIICKRKSDSLLNVKQVKFCTDPTNKDFALSFDWLLAKKKQGTSLLYKWSSSVNNLLAQQVLGDASLLTNRIPDEEIATALKGEHIDPGSLAPQRWADICREIGSEDVARSFFKIFRFLHSQPTIDNLEWNLKARLVPDCTDPGGWNSLLLEVQKWAMRKNEPPPDGKITHDVLKSVLSTRRPKPLSQEFFIPDGYRPPDIDFNKEFNKKVNTPGLYVLWGPPGRGKSTYLSYLVQNLRKNDVTVIRHHYFLGLTDTSGDRVSFVDISFSLMEQMRIYCSEEIRGLSSRADDLRECLVKCGEWSLKKNGKPFIIVIDGLDHVWRERHSLGAEQMNHLFSSLLPLPENVTLIVGTQKVDDNQLPRSLISQPNKWIKLPPMNAEAIRVWIELEAREGRLIAPDWAHKNNDKRRWLKEISDAFFVTTSGHPLHLIYSIESIVHRRAPVTEANILALPKCPDGDIRNYYNLLCRSLSGTAKEILHLLATSGFNWPPNGLLQCLGDGPDHLEAWKQIEHLLEKRRMSILPFHGSILAYMKELPEHGEASSRLLPKIVIWLGHAAPAYWQWAWLWLTKAKAGENGDIILGPSRQWMIESLCKGYPIDQIQKIIAGSERAALEAQAYPRLIELRALEIRLLNGFDYQTDRHADFLGCALMLSNDKDLIDVWADNLSGLDSDESVLISRFVTLKSEVDVAQQALVQVNNRLNYESEFGAHHGNELLEYGDAVAQLAAMADVDINRLLKYAKRWSDDGLQIFSSYVNELCKINRIEKLFDIWNVPALPKGFRQVLARACINEGCKRNLSLEKRPEADKILSHPLGFIYRYMATGKPFPGLSVQLPSPLSRGTVLQAEESALYVWDYFYADVATILSAKGKYELIPYPRDEKTPDWLAGALVWLQNQARRIADRIQSGQTVNITTLIKGASTLSPLSDKVDYDERSAYNRFCREVQKIAIDLHSLAMSQGRATPLSPEDIDAICIAPFWNYWNWFNEFKERPHYLLSQETANLIIRTLYKETKSEVSDMRERGDSYLDFAVFATHHKLHDLAEELLKKAADCITAYGNHKDGAVFDILNVIETCAEAGLGNTRVWLTKIAPAIEAIDKYTDGDGTRHAKGELVAIIGKYHPNLLASVYRRQVEREEWDNADETLVTAFKHIDLSDMDAIALAGTIENRGTLDIIATRAMQGEKAAARIIEERKDVFGAAYLSSTRDVPPSTNSNKGNELDRTALPSVADYPPENLNKFIIDARKDYGAGEKLLPEWLDYWVERNRGLEAINSIEKLVKTTCPHELDYLLDYVFEHTLKLKGKEAAYPWIVRAHIQLSGWNIYYYRNDRCLNRLRRVSEIYPDRWREYFRDVSEPRWKTSSEGSFVIGRDLFVYLLLLVGEQKLAIEVTEAMINTYLSEMADQPIGIAPWIKQ